MNRDDFIKLVTKHLDGQGSQIDVAGVLPKLFRAVLDWLETIGDLASLDTDHKSDLVSAINEIAGLVETTHFVISFSKSATEMKAIYDECAKNLTLAKNIVFYNSEDELYYRVNGYNIVNGILKLHAVRRGLDTTISLAPNGTLSIE